MWCQFSRKRCRTPLNASVVFFWYARGRHWTEPTCERCTSTCAKCVSYYQHATRTPTTPTLSTRKRSCARWTSRRWLLTTRLVFCSPLIIENQVDTGVVLGLQRSCGERDTDIIRRMSVGPSVLSHAGIVWQELIRRWDSERERFYYDIAHVLQNTKKDNLLRLTN